MPEKKLYTCTYVTSGATNYITKTIVALHVHVYCNFESSAEEETEILLRFLDISSGPLHTEPGTCIIYIVHTCKKHSLLGRTCTM